MALGVSVEIQGARRAAPRDRCPYPRPFTPDFTACPAYQATTFIAADSDDRQLHTHLTCRQLEIGSDTAQTGRFYPRCALGDSGQRRRWVARVGLERLELVRALQQEFDRFSDPHRKGLYHARERLSVAPADWQLRDEMDRQLVRYRNAIAGFLRTNEERFRDAGLPIAPLLELIEASLTTWARNRLDPASRLDGAGIRAFSPEAQAFLGSPVEASCKDDASPDAVVFDDGMLEVARAGGPPRLLLSGEIDASNADALTHLLARESAGREPLSVDLSGILFCDLAGLRAILSAAQRFEGGSSLGLYGMPHQVRRTMELAGFSPPANLVVYDRQPLAPSAISETGRSHPFVRQEERARESPASGLAQPAAFASPLPPPPEALRELAFESQSLRSLRATIMHEAPRAGLRSARMADLVVAVNEVATNSVRHGGGRGRLRVWRDDGALVCEVRDGGPISDPLSDRERPSADLRSSRGLWLANQLCDLVQVRTLGDGGVVRLRMRAA